MVLPIPRPYYEVVLAEGTTSIGTSPVAMNFVSPVSGYIQRVHAASSASVGATTTVAVTINGGSDIFGGALTLASGAAASNSVELPLTGTSAVYVNPGDFIACTPSGGSAATVTGACSVVIRAIS